MEGRSKVTHVFPCELALSNEWESEEDAYKQQYISHGNTMQAVPVPEYRFKMADTARETGMCPAVCMPKINTAAAAAALVAWAAGLYSRAPMFIHKQFYSVCRSIQWECKSFKTHGVMPTAASWADRAVPRGRLLATIILLRRQTCLQL